VSEKKVRQVEAIADGSVIDHIPPAATVQVANLISAPEDCVLIGINFASRALGRKGIVKISGRELLPETISRLALIAPQATLSIIRDYQVIEKSRVPVPEAFVGIARCPNPNCITNHEECTTWFAVLDPEAMRVRCRYCEREFLGPELALA